MDIIKQELLQLLTTLEYDGDKNEFIGSFLSISYQQVIINLIETLSPEAAKQFKNGITEKKYLSFEEGLKNFFTQDQILQALKEVITKNVQEAIESTAPSLNADHLTKLNEFVSNNSPLV